MLISLGLIALGLTLLVLGGEALLRGAVGIAQMFRLTPAVIGLTVVAAGTSVPELAVGAIAAAQGSVDLTVGNVVGSNVFNLAFILGVTALIAPLRFAGNTVKLEYPVLALVTLIGLALCDDGTFSRLDGVVCLAIYVCFTAYLVDLVRGQLTSAERREYQGEVGELAEDASPVARPATALGWTAAGVALLGCGAQATVSGASDLARILGWSERVIGLTIVAIGTGLPEVVTSLVSAFRGRPDVAIGNVIGSNLFNLLIVLGLTSLVRPLPIDVTILASDNWWMLGVTLGLIPLLASGRKLGRLEGLLLLAVYGVYVTLLLVRPDFSLSAP